MCENILLSYFKRFKTFFCFSKNEREKTLSLLISPKLGQMQSQPSGAQGPGLCLEEPESGKALVLSEMVLAKQPGHGGVAAWMGGVAGTQRQIGRLCLARSSQPCTWRSTPRCQEGDGRPSGPALKSPPPTALHWC